MDLKQWLNDWRLAVQQRANRLRGRLSDLVFQTEQLAPGVVYGATAGLTVLPLVAAAQGGTVPFVELASLLGSLGANLLSNELYAWKQRSEEELAEELPTHLGQLAAKDANWRDLLDKLIEKAQADAAVQAELGLAAAPYLEALQHDVQHLGSRLIVANVYNSKNVITGDHSTMTVHETHYHGAVSPINFANVLRAYLESERRQCEKLPLDRPKPDAPRAPRMQRVFVELRTTLPVDTATRTYNQPADLE
ncbi:MAG: hypothetical protein ACKO9F_07580, partial [Caldilinea sp.]